MRPPQVQAAPTVEGDAAPVDAGATPMAQRV